MDNPLFSNTGLEFLFRWFHFLAGVTWIGLLYYFNFVQGEWFKEADPSAKSAAIQKLVPRALAWFRYAALITFLTGLSIIAVRHSLNLNIVVGSLLGTLMFLNVWLIIWPNQKIVIASAKQAAGGGQPLPDAAAAGAKAALASRSNVLFSIPMLFFMGASFHLPGPGMMPIQEASMTALGVVALVLAALQLNAMKGKVGPMASIKGVIHCGVFLAIALYAIVSCL